MRMSRNPWRKGIGKSRKPKVFLFIFIHSCDTSIFVVHKDMDMDMDGPNWEPHDYWKMKITSLHKDESTGQKWVVGTWFYTPS
jgi:hypothetical protein